MLAVPSLTGPAQEAIMKGSSSSWLRLGRLPLVTPILTLVAVGVAFLAKITFELIAGSAVACSDAGKGLVPVPVAHVAGAMAAVLALWMAAAVPAVRRRSALLLLPLLFVSCLSLEGPAPAPNLPRNACASPDLNGVWTSRHTTLFGPTWQKLVLHPDCRYYVRYQLLFMRIRATGTYSIQNGTIRVNSQDLPFRREGGLLLVEENHEVIPYTRR